jgi:hypothetical protein
VSLFPIGSCVKLNDGRTGTVVRSNHDAYTAPVVEIWTPDSMRGESDVVNLNIEHGLDIVKAVPQLEFPLSAKLNASMEEDNWK